MLPLPMYTQPYHAPLNLATMMPAWSNPTDLGPKTYIAYGQVRALRYGCCGAGAAVRVLRCWPAVQVVWLWLWGNRGPRATLRTAR